MRITYVLLYTVKFFCENNFTFIDLLLLLRGKKR